MIATGFALITAVLVTAQVPDAAARAKAIAPFVDEQTILVARIDVTRVDVEHIVGRLKKLMRDPQEPDRPDPQLDRRLAEMRQGLEQWITGFTKAGGRDYYVVSPMDLFPAIVVVVPLAPAADAEALSKLLGVRKQVASAPAGRNGPPFRPEVARRVGGMLVVGGRKAVERVGKTTPAARGELVKAFEAAGDGAIQLLLLPTDDSRRVMAELMPKLPDALGGGPSSALTDGMRWAAVGVRLKPDLAAIGVIQSTDAAAAKALGEVVKRIYAEGGTVSQHEVHDLREIIDTQLLGTSLAQERLAEIDRKRLQQLLQTKKLETGTSAGEKFSEALCIILHEAYVRLEIRSDPTESIRM